MSDSNVQNPDGQPEAGQDAGNAGFQKRIDELTAARYEAEGRAKAIAEEAQRNQERLMAQFQALQAQQVQSQPQANPFADLDPTLAKALEAISAKQSAQIEALQRTIAAQASANAVEQAAGNVGTQDPNVKRRAAELAAAWTREGRQGWNPEDAVLYAEGEALRAARIAAQRDPLGRFQPAQFQGQAPRQNFQPQSATPALPSNFDSLSPSAQIEILKKRGVDDIPF